MPTTLVVVWGITVVAAAAIGAIIAHLLLRARHAVTEAQFQAFERERQETIRRLQESETHLRLAEEAKARAEQDARRLPELEQQLDNLRNANMQLVAQLSELKTQRQADQERIQLLEDVEKRLRDAFQSLAAQTLQSNADEFLKRARDQLDILLTQVRGDWSNHRTQLDSLLKPLQDMLKTMDNQVRELEQKREGAYQGLQEQLRQLGQTHQQLQSTAVSLLQALRSPTVRGNWGEHQLRRIVEMANMTKQVDFREQANTDQGRPDMIVFLPNRGILPVDAKAPMQAYLDAMAASDDHVQREKLASHAAAMRNRVRELAQREYWNQFAEAPQFVIMFVPSEACLSAAFQSDPELFDYAAQQRVLITSPVTLLALLKAVAYGWQQHQLAENARQIAQQGKELHDRLARFLEHFQKIGRSLDAVVKAYNDATGSLESRFFPSARRLKELGASTEELPDLRSVDTCVRLLAVQDKTEDSP
jgi:DNA recombination protein RmuC